MIGTLELNKVHCGDCLDLFKEIPDNSIDLIVTSPSYNVGINYDVHNDKLPMNEYFEFAKKWLKECYRVIKKDGRIAINLFLEINLKERGGRIFLASEYWTIMKEIGFKWFGIVDLKETKPHRVKFTAWGSYMSSSGPYIYNPKECIILAYKEKRIKENKGSSWDYKIEQFQNNGKIINKKLFSDDNKNEFKELVCGEWKYRAETQGLTKACFSLDIPLKAIKILTYENDIVLDPFAGSNTTGLAAKMLNRKWLGFELSQNYTDIGNKRVEKYQIENIL